MVVGRPSLPMKSTVVPLFPLMSPGVACEPDPGGADSGDRWTLQRDSTKKPVLWIGLWRGNCFREQSHPLSRRGPGPMAWRGVTNGDLVGCSGWPCRLPRSDMPRAFHDSLLNRLSWPLNLKVDLVRPDRWNIRVRGLSVTPNSWQCGAEPPGVFIERCIMVTQHTWVPLELIQSEKCTSENQLKLLEGIVYDRSVRKSGSNSVPILWETGVFFNAVSSYYAKKKKKKKAGKVLKLQTITSKSRRLVSFAAEAMQTIAGSYFEFWFCSLC